MYKWISKNKNFKININYFSFSLSYFSEIIPLSYHFNPKFFTRSTLFFSTWYAGVIHFPHEHFFPEKITSPNFDSHLGQLNLISLSRSFTSSQVGCSINIDVQSLSEWTTELKSYLRHFLHLYFYFCYLGYCFWTTSGFYIIVYRGKYRLLFY